MNDQPESTQYFCASVEQINGGTPVAALADVNLNVRQAEFYSLSTQANRLWPLLSSAQDPATGDGRNNEFMTVFSHELRNSLGAIRSATRILRMETSSGPPAVTARMLIER